MALELSDEVLVIGKDNISLKDPFRLSVFDAYKLSDDIQIRIGFNKKTDASALYRYIKYSKNRPDNYICLDTNDNYESLTGFKREEVRGKLVTEIVGEHKDYAEELIKKFYATAVFGKEQYFSINSKLTGRDYVCYAYSPRKYYFNLFFKEDSDTRNLDYQNDIYFFIRTLDSLSTSDFIICEREDPLSGTELKKIKIISSEIAKILGILDDKTEVLEPLSIKVDLLANRNMQETKDVKNLITDKLVVLSRFVNSPEEVKSLTMMIKK